MISFKLFQAIEIGNSCSENTSAEIISNTNPSLRSTKHPTPRSARTRSMLLKSGWRTRYPSCEGMQEARSSHPNAGSSHLHPHFHECSVLREPNSRKATATFIEFNENKQMWCGVEQEEPIKAELFPTMGQVINGCNRHWKKVG